MSSFRRKIEPTHKSLDNRFWREIEETPILSMNKTNIDTRENENILEVQESLSKLGHSLLDLGGTQRGMAPGTQGVH